MLFCCPRRFSYGKCRGFSCLLFKTFVHASISLSGRRCRNLPGAEEFVIGFAEDAGQGNQFNVGDEALSGLHALNRIFVDVQPGELQSVSKRALGNAECFAAGGNVRAAEVVFPVGGLVDEHFLRFTSLFDIQYLSIR